MKKLLQIIVCFLFVATGMKVNAQSVQVTNTTSSAICDGSASFSDTSDYQEWVWMQGTNILQTGGTHFTGRCAGQYSIICTPSGGGTDLAVNFEIGAGNGAPCNFTAYMYATQNVSAAGVCDGSLTAAATGGGGSTFSWSNGNTGNVAHNLCANVNYTVTVTNMTGCMTTATAMVGVTSNPCDSLEVGFTDSQDATSNTTCDGSYTAVATGGTAPYAFTWNDPAETVGAVNNTLCANVNYTVTVTDANGCEASANGTVNTINCSGLTVGFADSLNATSNTSCDGSYTAVATGGTAPYTFVWNDSTETVGAVNNALCANVNYTVTVTDANGCEASAIANVGATSINCNGFVVSASFTDVSAPGVCDGAITTTIAGGTAPYAYSWNSGQTTSDVINMCGGYYGVTVTDAEGCVFGVWGNIYGDTAVVPDLVISANPVNVSEDGVCDGSVFIAASGGQAPFQYSLSGGQVSTDGNFTALCQGIYTANVYDALGDTAHVNFIVSNPANTYINNNYQDSVYIDSIYNILVENCTLNYQTIDSVYISSFQTFGDSVVVYWYISMGTESAMLTEYYYLGSGNGVYSLGLQVYCPGKVVGNYFTARDQIYYNTALGIQENSLEDISVYPNPVDDQLNIRLTKMGDYEVSLFDVSGREIMQSKNKETKEIILNVSMLSKGQYILKVSGNNGFIAKSIVK